MKKLFLVIGFFIVLSSCNTRGCQRIERNFQMTAKDYHIKQFSGGQLIGEWKFNGIVNSEKESDGYFFYYDSAWVEISGDIQIVYK